ncbi:MAG: TIGR03936 family radical SAM-associated protein [Candidatus Omnitrophota bacterium]|nr:TIGR03936 family radical SAM-associated protein [Candidatus Omnitrophota bacterium]
MIKFSAIFHKKGNMAYISHLDLMTVIRRSMRRTSLPLVLTEGFTPRVKISIPKALKLGNESMTEEMTIWLGEHVSVEKIKEEMNACLPEGIGIEKITIEHA